ncbi:hypothetical protein DPMN_017339 [Dreissena polymorpha]|uniref:Uncharacterized protein n=1 Tax=Dreissena polymorpha TaxID=45954 RepID=A0A9D4ND05_DREPO|nr:hypothetical protein DPMN_017339 [Dreissena polymorpha]
MLLFPEYFAGGKAEADAEIEEQIEVEQNSEIEGADEDYVYSDDFELSDGELSDIEDDDEINMYVEKNRDLNPDLPETVTLLETSWGSKVYLVGTAHFSAESQEDVAKVTEIIHIILPLEKQVLMHVHKVLSHRISAFFNVRHSLFSENPVKAENVFRFSVNYKEGKI